MAETIIAIFNSPADAIEAAGELRHRGFDRSDVTLMSAEPIHTSIHYGPGSSRSLIGLFAIGGGILGATAALALTIGASRQVGLVTGGMPIVTPWAFGIIVFELGALGAILASLTRMVWEARLARPGALREYDAAVSSGKVVMSVKCSDEAERDSAVRLLSAADAEIKGELG